SAPFVRYYIRLKAYTEGIYRLKAAASFLNEFIYNNDIIADIITSHPAAADSKSRQFTAAPLPTNTHNHPPHPAHHNYTTTKSPQLHHTHPTFSAVAAPAPAPPPPHNSYLKFSAMAAPSAPAPKPPLLTRLTTPLHRAWTSLKTRLTPRPATPPPTGTRILKKHPAGGGTFDPGFSPRGFPTRHSLDRPASFGSLDRDFVVPASMGVGFPSPEEPDAEDFERRVGRVSYHQPPHTSHRTPHDQSFGHSLRNRPTTPPHQRARSPPRREESSPGHDLIMGDDDYEYDFQHDPSLPNPFAPQHMHGVQEEEDEEDDDADELSLRDFVIG
ncbi:hypothetical protein EJ06DRAFT_61606, partial [Trichodelitschia bisporula]